jgi:hydrogenase nickel incorporation protein HypA/HybF
MHELKIAEDLKNIVLEAASKGNLTKVTRVNVTFGQMVQIVPEIFQFAFTECVRDSTAEGAEVIIEIVPVKMACNNCGTEFIVKDKMFACHKCSSADLKIINGKELFVNSIEGE